MASEFKIKEVIETNGTVTQEVEASEVASSLVDSYKIFTMPSCEKCEAAKGYLNDIGMAGAIVDLSAKEGVREFREYYKNLKDQIKRNEDGSLPIKRI
jgi:glutaredoxin